MENRPYTDWVIFLRPGCTSHCPLVSRDQIGCVSRSASWLKLLQCHSTVLLRDGSWCWLEARPGLDLLAPRGQKASLLN